MKKSLLVLSTLSFVLFLAGTAGAEMIDKSVNLVVGKSQAQINGNSVTLSAPAKVIDGRMLVPLRFISEAFGCDVQWNGDLHAATVKLVDQTIEVPVGKNYAVINGDKTEVQVPAQLINGSTYVPLRFMSENLGANVDYNVSTRDIDISMKLYSNKDQNFEMVLPTDWVIEEETSEGVKLSAYGSCIIQVGFQEKSDTIGVSNFNEFAEACFKEYEANDVLNKVVNGVCAVVVYKEDGVIMVNAFKLLEDGIYYVAFATPEESLDANLAGQCDLMINSLKSLAIK